MRQYIQFLTFSITLITKIFCEEIPKYPKFECMQSDFQCFLSQVNLNATTTHFTIIPHRNASEIDAISFISSKMQILTSDVCVTLPNVKNFDAHGLGLTRIDQDAFRNCTKLSEVSLYDNFLVHLPLGIFESNFDLSKVWLQNNNLTEVDKSLFKNHPALTFVDFDKNHLKDVSFLMEMPLKEKLTRINLCFNELENFDVALLLEICLNLEKIQLRGNKFLCEWQEIIIENLTVKNVTFDELGECRNLSVLTTARTELRAVGKTMRRPKGLKILNSAAIRGFEDEKQKRVFIVIGLSLAILMIIVGVALFKKMKKSYVKSTNLEAEVKEPSEKKGLESQV